MPDIAKALSPNIINQPSASSELDSVHPSRRHNFTNPSAFANDDSARPPKDIFGARRGRDRARYSSSFNKKPKPMEKQRKRKESREKKASGGQAYVRNHL
jgi:hypothetical protein